MSRASARSWVIRHRASTLLISASLSVSCLALLRSNFFIENIPRCPIKAVIGVDCPGCGSGRCLNALARMDFYQAIDQNLVIAVGLPLFLLFGLFWISGFYPHRLAEKFAELSLFTAPILLGLVFGFFWIARLMPVEVGRWLASGLYSA